MRIKIRIRTKTFIASATPKMLDRFLPHPRNLNEFLAEGTNSW